MGSPFDSLSVGDMVRAILYCATGALGASAWAFMLAPVAITHSRLHAAIAGAVVAPLALFTWFAVTSLASVLTDPWPPRTGSAADAISEAMTWSLIFTGYGVVLAGWFLIPTGVIGALWLHRRYARAPVATEALESNAHQ
jgi:hypothetical protein